VTGPAEAAPTGVGDGLPDDALAEATQAVAERWLTGRPEGLTSGDWDQARECARTALAAALPAIRRHIADQDRTAAFEMAADEIHREALWQKESQMRGMFANGETSVDRLLMLEGIIRAFGKLPAARGGETDG
jgi:enoyl-CoA hydratase/carnithine racemase